MNNDQNIMFDFFASPAMELPKKTQDKLLVALGKLPPPDEKSFSKNVDYVMDRAVDMGLLTVSDVKEVAKQMSTETGKNAMCVGTTSLTLMKVAGQSGIEEDKVYSAFSKVPFAYKQDYFKTPCEG